MRAATETLARQLRHYDPSQLPFQLQEIVEDRSYLRKGISVGEGDVVLDVGANVGVAAVFFAQECKARLVHSFEPVAPLFDLLCQNVARYPTCVPHPYGLSDSHAETSITFYPAASAMSGLHADPRADRDLVSTVMRNSGMSAAEIDAALEGRYRAEILSCELRPLSSVLREEGLDRVDLLKIDVERAELDVLHGLGDEDWPAIRQIVVEVQDEDGRAEAIMRLLRDHGFHVTADQEPLMRGTGVRLVYGSRG